MRHARESRVVQNTQARLRLRGDGSCDVACDAALRPPTGSSCEDFVERHTQADEADSSASLNGVGPALPQIVVLTGIQAGLCVTLTPGRVCVGRATTADVMVDHHSVSRQHCEIWADAAARVWVRDLGSTNGTVVDDLTIGPGWVEAQNGSQIRLSREIVLQVRQEAQVAAQLYEDLYEKAVRDPLTGLYNKRVLLERFEQDHAQARRSKRPLCAMVIDIDHFKQVNDTHGHDVGDQVLAAVASVISANVRVEDLAARFGGEEFVLLLRDTPAHVAGVLAERLRKKVAAVAIEHGDHIIQVTVSTGYASSREPGVQVPMDLFTRADRRLYEAKHAGRDRVVGPIVP